MTKIDFTTIFLLSVCVLLGIYSVSLYSLHQLYYAGPALFTSAICYVTAFDRITSD